MAAMLGLAWMDANEGSGGWWSWMCDFELVVGGRGEERGMNLFGGG